MKRKPKQWEDEDEAADIIGTGSYQFIQGGSGKSKVSAIGFIRPKEKTKQNRKPGITLKKRK